MVAVSERQWTTNRFTTAAQNRVAVIADSLNAPEPVEAPPNKWLYPAVSGHHNFSATPPI
jgi:hypothetical protein